MSSEHLHQVTIALIISRLHYALPVWAGFLTIDLCNRIQGLLKRLYRAGYIKYYMSFADLSIEVSQDLFSNIQRLHHCLISLATCISAIRYFATSWVQLCIASVLQYAA